MIYPFAVAALLRRVDGKILAVSRRNDPTKFGLPGGKVELGEALTWAVWREVLEETGTILGTSDVPDDPSTLIEIYRAVCPGEVTYESVIFVSTVKPKHRGHPEEGLTIAWVDQAILERGPFGDFNRNLLTQYLASPDAREYIVGLDEEIARARPTIR